MSTQPRTFNITEVVASTSANTIVYSVAPTSLHADAFDLLLLQVVCSASATVTGVAATNKLAGYTWVKAGSHNDGTNNVELWVGYGTPDLAPTANAVLTVSLSAAVTKRMLRLAAVEMSAPQTSPVVSGGAGLTGTTSPQSTPGVPVAAGDLYVACGWADQGSSSTRQSTVDEPVGLVGDTLYASTSTIVRSHRMVWRQSPAAETVNAQWVLAAAARWTSVAATITPNKVVTPEDGHTYKGRDLASLDTAGAL